MSDASEEPGKAPFSLAIGLYNKPLLSYSLSLKRRPQRLYNKLLSTQITVCCIIFEAGALGIFITIITVCCIIRGPGARARGQGHGARVTGPGACARKILP